MGNQDQERRRRQAQSRDGLLDLRAKRKCLPCQQDDISQGAAHIEIPSLPEDIWRHIHSLMSMRDAARAACVSRSFVSSWRCHSNLSFSSKILGLNNNACGEDKLATEYYNIVDHILTRHSGIGIKKLKIEIGLNYSAKGSCYLNNWLQNAVKPGIEELSVMLRYNKKHNFNFPCSLLSNGSGDSVKCLYLSGFSFHPGITFGDLRSLTRLHLSSVCIKDDELSCLLSHSLALELLDIRYCDSITRLKVPCILQRLSHLIVLGCSKLKVIDNEAPNVSSFEFQGYNSVQLSLGETLQMKSLCVERPGYIFHARANLPSIMPNLESLTIDSYQEVAYAPMSCSKFLYLRHLSIRLTGAPFFVAYDYLSLASFINAAPLLETFNLYVWQLDKYNVSIFADAADLRLTREEQHHSLKSVRINAFNSAKSLVELTCHILENTTSLECLTLEAAESCYKNSETGKCVPFGRDISMEGQRGILAIRRYIEPMVPSTVKLHVLEPCSCLAIED
uniref:Uncharacterized protein n=1 Tax=Leersia perrieri TaxID=77586 RepID=A0A0D9VAK6_9ORYZ